MSKSNALANARLTLLQKNILFGSLAMRLDIKEDPTCKTAYTDGKNLGFNPKWVDTLTSEEKVGLVAHEVAHCMFLHFSRRNNRDTRIWNHATDYVINGILLANGFKLPRGGLINPIYAAQASEEVFAILEQQKKEEEQKKQQQKQGDPGQDGKSSPGDKSSKEEKSEKQDSNKPESDSDGKEDEKSEDKGSKGKGKGSDSKDAKNDDKGEDGGEGEGDSSGESEDSDEQDPYADEDTFGEVRDGAKDASEAEACALEEEWQLATNQALLQFPKIGKNIGHGLEGIVRSDRRNRVCWQDLLADFLKANGKDDYNWMRPSRRSGDDYVTPSLHNPRLQNFVVVLDTSGSINSKQLTEFVVELNAILAVSQCSITVLNCDTDVRSEDTYTSQDVPVNLFAKGRGGTRLGTAFKYIEDKCIDCDGVIFFSDLMNDFWGVEPLYPVLWLYNSPYPKIPTHKPPFGEVVSMAA